MKKNYLFFLAILPSTQSFGLQYAYGDSAYCTSKTASNFRQWIYSPCDFAAVSPSGNIEAYMKAFNGNSIANLTVKMGAMGLKHMFNMLNLNS